MTATQTCSAGAEGVAALPVPYVTAWSGEALPQALAFEYHEEAAGLRLTYTDPHPGDWAFGVLRARQAFAPGSGRPEWKLVHTARQWRCMEYHLCQVCGGPATDGEGRAWWVLADTHGTDAAAGYTNAPPTCRGCVPAAVASCPRLRRGAAVYSAGGSYPFAVLGDVFEFGTGGARLMERHVLVELEEFRRLTQVLAHQLVVTLDDLRSEVVC